MFIVIYLMLIICVLISVAYTTLFERKLLGYMQLRKGPNSVGIMGLFQPFSDGLKLFSKEMSYPMNSNFICFFFIPVFMLILSCMLWILFPFIVNGFGWRFDLLFFINCLGIGVFGVLLSGWSSNSIYSLLGGIRALAQAISYEVSMILILVNFMILISGFELMLFLKFQQLIWFCFLSMPLFLCWLCSCLAETNRSPFDFAEGESELVSGFNVEYSSGSFAYIFLAEYMNIIFMSMVSCVLFLGSDFNSFLFFLKVAFLIFFFIWVRGTLPRYRYDKLMYLTWKVFLPVVLGNLLFFSGILLLII